MIPPRPYTLLAPETAIERADRERTEHLTACDRCIAGLDCPTGDDLDRRLTEAASGDLPWPPTPTIADLQDAPRSYKP